MFLYRWNSPALAGYIDGDIIAIGKNVGDARDRVAKEARRVYAGDPRKLADILRDVEARPTRTMTPCLISGSE